MGRFNYDNLRKGFILNYHLDRYDSQTCWVISLTQPTFRFNRFLYRPLMKKPTDRIIADYFVTSDRYYEWFEENVKHGLRLERTKHNTKNVWPFNFTRKMV